ncbi:uncharacterized protein LOC131637156 [Vicia villosa]|uniref:uncharacterized protein LOC131637156 n=1 Tax=Vicia villosa TaxID=3911 RepID=UPI00273AA62E|nr:uncharacterized protein LOC131637156 [Vicia villosa]
MEACIFTSHMSILVNGSATRDFKVQKGLRQGDWLSPFLFVLAMEGLTSLVRKSVELGDFNPFKYGVVEGVNIGDWLMSSAATFLACKKGNIPFSFLGIVVGENPRRKKVWKKVIDNIKNILSSWKGRNISIGGRVMLINVVLNAIPFFTFSFYKAPTKVLKEIKGLQSNFLWSGNVNKRSIHWVKWDTICKPKEKGGLGVRDFGEFNKVLLLKWKWRFLKEDKAIWSSFMGLRYHNIKLKVIQPSREALNSDESIWWGDVISNDVKADTSEDGFNSCVQCRVKKRNNTLFWHSIWLGEWYFHLATGAAVRLCY